ncbi:hypothetical protein PMAYCL1PPCAC_17156, partial [Pristionchus mayeri]
SILNPCSRAPKLESEISAARCKDLVTELGADFDEARKCIIAHQPRIQKAADCSRKALGEMCTDKPGAMIKKHGPETIQIAAIKEITAMVKKSGLLDQAKKLIEQGAKAAVCMRKCGSSTDCGKKLDKCSAALPSDNEIVAKVKTCALDVGFDTKLAQEICTCLNKAGIKALDDACPKIMLKLAVLSIVLLGVLGAGPEMQQQCLCKDFDPCYETAADTVLKCTDKYVHLLVTTRVVR